MCLSISNLIKTLNLKPCMYKDEIDFVFCCLSTSGTVFFLTACWIFQRVGTISPFLWALHSISNSVRLWGSTLELEPTLNLLLNLLFLILFSIFVGLPSVVVCFSSKSCREYKPFIYKWLSIRDSFWIRDGGIWPFLLKALGHHLKEDTCTDLVLP